MLLDTQLIPSDAAELQNVLTRYTDSYHGYLQAAQAVEEAHLAEAFRAIAARRKIISAEIAKLIGSQGVKPDKSGSPEGAIHRWWLQFRANMSQEEFRAILDECVRGEKTLARAITDALENGHLEKHHHELILKVAEELAQAISVFESALNS